MAAAPIQRPSAELAAAARTDRRAELALGALAFGAFALIALMVATVVIKAWPSFSHNGLSWFGSGGDVATELRVMREGTPLPGHGLLYFRAWPLIWGTVVTTVVAVVLALVISTLGGRVPDRIRTRPREARARTGRPAARGGAVGDLRVDRHPRPRSLDQRTT